MALLDTEQVKLEQIFLPYLRVTPERSLYDTMADNGFKALSPGEDKQ